MADSALNLPAGFEMLPPPSAAEMGLPNGWEAVVTKAGDEPELARPGEQPSPKRQGELRSYEPSWRDRIASFLTGDEKPSSQRERAVELLMGSRGLGRTGMSAVDLTPAGIPLAGDEAQRDAKKGDWIGATANAMAMIPAAKPGAMALKPATEAAREFVRKASLPAETQATLRARGVSSDSLPMMREGDNLVPNPGYGNNTPVRGEFYDAELRPNITKPNAEGISPKRAMPEPQPSKQRVWDEATDTYTFRDIPATPKGPVYAKTEEDLAPSIGRAQVWMINGKGEVRNSLEIPGKVSIDNAGKMTRNPEGWHPLYDAPGEGARKRDLTPAEAAASRAMWGNPTGSLWDQSWMPTTAPQGVKDAVAAMKTKGLTWGDVLTNLVNKMEADGTPKTVIQQQMPVIAAQVARNLGTHSAQPVGAK